MLSVVMCSRDDQRFAAAEATWAKAMNGAAYEIVRVPDARSMCEGYNRGYLQAKGERIVFCHDDAFFLSSGLAEKLVAHFDHLDVFGVVGSTTLAGPAFHLAGPPHNYGQLAIDTPPHGLRVTILNAPARRVAGMQALDGVLIAATRRAVERLDGWDEAIPGFHCYDVDFAFRAHLARLRVGVACDLDLLHTSAGRYDTPEWAASAEVFIRTHGPHVRRFTPFRWTDTNVFTDDLAHAVRLMQPPHWAPL
jgi:hypothetical protein